MFLKSLSIINNTTNTTIREINFHKGVNLILDETSSANKTESGNNVGKTTVFRLIDYCLYSDGKNIYTDTEFGNTNVEVEQFLTTNDIIIKLVLVSELDNASGEIIIERNFLSKKQSVRRINGENYTSKNFEQTLKLLLFGNCAEKPTFRQLISKNIRYEKNRLVNTIKVLHQNTYVEVYESLFLFWLGIDFSESGRKQQLYNLKKTEENFQTKMHKSTDMAKISQALSVIESSIKELENKKNDFQLNDNYNKDIEELNNLKFKESQISAIISRLEFRRDLINENVNALNSKQANIDTEAIKVVYEEAKAIIPNLQKSFEDTLHFHNQMIDNKIKFLTNNLDELLSEINNYKIQLNVLLEKDKDLSNKLKSLGVLEGLEEIIRQLNIEYERKGNYEEQKRLLEDSERRLMQYEEELNEINKGISNQKEFITNRVKHFNTFFTKISKELYDEDFILVDKYNDRALTLIIDTISSNPGTGKKKGQMASFDLSYVQYADSLDIKCLHFILQDQMESVHSNQISSLFAKVVEESNCQYVMTMLKDKLPSNMDVSPYVVLTLSQSDKLFKI
ncbi:MAG: DUF2326 domain-containing protein [Paludibacteraceae bacterium]|nr:DUF2326 domain-containing protein [Paludibacteraceae bacterium]